MVAASLPPPLILGGPEQKIEYGGGGELNLSGDLEF